MVDRHAHSNDTGVCYHADEIAICLCALARLLDETASYSGLPVVVHIRESARIDSSNFAKKTSRLYTAGLGFLRRRRQDR